MFGGYLIMDNNNHNGIPFCICDDCADRAVHSILSETEKRRILDEANRIAREAHRKVDDLIGWALTGRPA